MAVAEASILARKSSRGAVEDGAPEMARLQAGVADAAEAALRDLLRGEIKVETGEIRRLALTDALAEYSEPGIFYWIEDETGAPAVLVCVQPAVASVMTERLLGGELRAPDGRSVAAPFDCEMAVALVDLLTGPLNALVQKLAGPAPGVYLTGHRVAGTHKEVVQDLDGANVLVAPVGASFAGVSAPGAVSFAFRESYLNRAGLLADAPLREAAPADSGWRERVRRNILNTDIELTVLIGRVQMNIGDLSRLAVDDVVEVGADALQTIDIAAMTSDGPVTIAQGRLGAYRTQKAVKLTTSIDPDFLRGL